MDDFFSNGVPLVLGVKGWRWVNTQVLILALISPSLGIAPEPATSPRRHLTPSLAGRTTDHGNH